MASEAAAVTPPVGDHGWHTACQPFSPVDACEHHQVLNPRANAGAGEGYRQASSDHFGGRTKRSWLLITGTPLRGCPDAARVKAVPTDWLAGVCDLGPV